MFNVVAAYRNLDWNSSEAGQRIKVNTGVLTTGKWFCCPGMLTLRGGTRPSGETSCVLPPLPTSQLVMTVQLTRMLSKMLEILYPKLCRMLLHTNMCLWLYKWFLSHRGSVDRYEISRQYKEHLESVSWIGNWRCISRSPKSGFQHIMCKC